MTDEKLLAQINELGGDLPKNLGQLSVKLTEVSMYREYDAAANRACALVWQALPAILDHGPSSLLLAFASAHMVPAARARILRRLAKAPSSSVRRQARKAVEKDHLHEVALPAREGGPWDATGWLAGTEARRLQRHRQGQRVQERHGVPRLANLADLRQLLGIQSPRQLGYFLLASDADNGPYTVFTIPKRNGGQRGICAPKPQLRWVQRQILSEVLAKVPAHAAAHGFVAGRSTVTNAAPHRGAELVIKFDLQDFFPTIHFYRVLGLFARLGYQVGDGRFASADESTHVAPTLARLCCYTPAPRQWGNALLPQGAPTSPTISNLVCRRLDARLAGLAKGRGGAYTRYADDLTFSFPKADLDVGRFRWWVDQVCHQEGFLVHQSKFRVVRRSQRQLVTGIVVNDSLRVPRDQRRRFRAILHNCRQHGLVSQARGNAHFGDYLRGFASYLHMVHPEEGDDFLKQVADLLGPGPEEVP